MENFIIGKLLGKGSFGQVCLVKRIKDGQIYAMKQVKIQNLSDKEKQNTLNEIRILASLSHKNIIGYKESFFDENSKTLNIVMEYADDGDLLTKIKNNIKNKVMYKEIVIWFFFVQILEGLNFLHENKIIHRDLKNANIFLTKDGTVKIGDLNVSKITKKNEMATTKTGTPYYVAPEIWMSRPYEYKCDIWSLGCILYELCKLKPPFRGTNIKILAKNIKEGDYEPISDVYSNDLRYIINSMLRKDPNERPTAKELINGEIVQNKIKEYKLGNPFGNMNNIQYKGLMGTIKVPSNIEEINKNLPGNKYNNRQRREEMLIEDEYETIRRKNGFLNEEDKKEVKNIFEGNNLNNNKQIKNNFNNFQLNNNISNINNRAKMLDNNANNIQVDNYNKFNSNQRNYNIYNGGNILPKNYGLVQKENNKNEFYNEINNKHNINSKNIFNNNHQGQYQNNNIPNIQNINRNKIININKYNINELEENNIKIENSINYNLNNNKNKNNNIKNQKNNISNNSNLSNNENNIFNIRNNYYNNINNKYINNQINNNNIINNKINFQNNDYNKKNYNNLNNNIQYNIQGNKYNNYYNIKNNIQKNGNIIGYNIKHNNIYNNDYMNIQNNNYNYNNKNNNGYSNMQNNNISYTKNSDNKNNYENNSKLEDYSYNNGNINKITPKFQIINESPIKHNKINNNYKLDDANKSKNSQNNIKNSNAIRKSKTQNKNYMANRYNQNPNFNRINEKKLNVNEVERKSNGLKEIMPNNNEINRMKIVEKKKIEKNININRKNNNPFNIKAVNYEGNQNYYDLLLNNSNESPNNDNKNEVNSHNQRKDKFYQYKEGNSDKQRPLSSANFKNRNIHNQNNIIKSQNYNLKNNEFNHNQQERKSNINKRGNTPNYNMHYNNHNHNLNHLNNNNSRIVGQKAGRMNNISNNFIKPKRNNNKVIIEKIKLLLMRTVRIPPRDAGGIWSRACVRLLQTALLSLRCFISRLWSLRQWATTV